MEEEKEDLISNLPESIIGVILSKVPTKYAVGTAVLSTQWRYLFYSIPNPSIEIDDAELLHPDSSGSPSPNPNPNPNPSFINFVSRLFNHILPQFSFIQELSLKLHHHYGNERIDEWISLAPSTCNVGDLSLIFPENCGGISSLAVLRPFTSLCHLDLEQYCDLVVPKSTLFPNLTKLSLLGVGFVGVDSFGRALAACPSLRSLMLARIRFPLEQAVVRISVPSLRVLVIHRCSCNVFELIIDTPVLDFLGYCGYVDQDLFVDSDFPTLYEAVIYAKQRASEGELVSNQGVAKLLAACSRVKTLKFHVSGVEVSNEAIFPRLSFSNLTDLELNVFDIVGWERLPKFLQKSPILRVLVCYKVLTDDNVECYERFQNCLPYSVPTCLSSHLSEVVFREFKGEKAEVKLVQYFLRTAGVLDKMKICFVGSSLSHDEELGIQKDILKSPMCSTKCQIDFVMHS